MFILDTDHLTVIQRQSEPAYSCLLAQFRGVSPGEIFTTIISFEEQMRGWLAVISRFRTIQQEIAAYRQLHALLSFFAEIPVLDFDEPAAEQFSGAFLDSRLQIGPNSRKSAVPVSIYRENTPAPVEISL